MKLSKKLGAVVASVSLVVAVVAGCSVPAPMVASKVVVPDQVFNGGAMTRGSVAFSLVPTAPEGSKYKIQAEERARLFADIKSLKIEFVRTPEGAPVYQYMSNVVRDGLPYTFSGLSAPDNLYVRVTFYDAPNQQGRIINKNGVAMVSASAYAIADQQVTTVALPIALLDGWVANGDATVAMGVVAGSEGGVSFAGSDPVDPTPPPQSINWEALGYGTLDPMMEVSSFLVSNPGPFAYATVGYDVPQSWAGDQLRAVILDQAGNTVAETTWYYDGMFGGSVAINTPDIASGMYYVAIRSLTRGLYGYTGVTVN